MKNTNNKNFGPYIIMGSITALGGIALGAAGSWVYNKFRKRKSYITNNVSDVSNVNTHTQMNTTLNTDTSEGVYIKEDDETIFLTNTEFQRYFEYNIKNDDINVEWCILEYALKNDPMNLQFLNDEQKTVAFEQFAVKHNIKAIIYCKYTTETYKPQNNNEVITYNKYEIHDFAYDLYGIEIYKYITIN